MKRNICLKEIANLRKEYSDVFLLLLFNSIICEFRNRDRKVVDMAQGVLYAFSKLIAQIKIDSKNVYPFYLDTPFCNKIKDKLYTSMYSLYNYDYKELLKRKDNGKISNSQMGYELSSPKSYPNIFIINLYTRLKPFESLIKQKWNLEIEDISSGIKTIEIKYEKDYSALEYFSKKTWCIDGVFPVKFMDDLINSNKNAAKFYCFNKSTLCPILKREENYFVLNFDLFIDSIYNNIIKCLMLDKTESEKSELGKIKGEVFNEYCGTVLKKSFIASKIFYNYQYSVDNKKGEIDIVLIDKDVLILCECKNRNYSHSSMGENDDYLKYDAESFDKATAQVLDPVNYLKNKGILKLRKKGLSDLVLNKENYNYVIPLVFNLENLGELNFDYKNRNNNLCYFSLDDITTIVEIIKKRSYLFVDFISQLSDKDKFEKEVTDDLMNVFVYYLVHIDLDDLYTGNVNLKYYANKYLEKHFNTINNNEVIDSISPNLSKNIFSESCTYKCLIQQIHKFNK